MSRSAIGSALALFAIMFPVLGDAITPAEMQKQFPDTHHSLATLPQGVTHYEDRGDRRADAIVLVHGVSGPMLVWDRVVEDMVADKHRVLRYDLFGRGYSTRFDTDAQYNLNTYVVQLEDLLAERKVERPMTLVGSSFGAVISAEFTLRHPERVARLVLVGPAGFPIETPTLAKLRDVPLIGDLLFAIAGKGQILEQNRKYFADLAPPKVFWERFTAQLSIDGMQRRCEQRCDMRP